MIPTGLDRISFYAPRYRLALATLAAARNVDPDKYRVGLGQENMAVPPPDEDTVTMAAAAARPIVEQHSMETLRWLILATETGVDQSKSAGLFVHGLLGLPTRCRVIEIKQACYGATAGLRMACASVGHEPDTTALVIASDIARYAIGSPGEPTQGSGAVAMLVAAHPRILAIDPLAGLHAEDVMDFWRPNYRQAALVDGRYSTRMYLQTAARAFAHYREAGGPAYTDLDRCCYHLPFTRMAGKAHQQLAARVEPAAVSPRTRKHGRAPAEEEQVIGLSLAYNRQTGNTYTASLYEALTCLLDTAPDNLAGERIGLFSYGSGCTGEFFSGTVIAGYRDQLFSARHRAVLEDRTELTIQAYEDILNLRVPEDGLNYLFAPYRNGGFRLAGIREHKRFYEAVA